MEYLDDFFRLTSDNTTDDIEFLMKWETGEIVADDVQKKIDAINLSGKATYENTRELKYEEAKSISSYYNLLSEMEIEVLFNYNISVPAYYNDEFSEWIELEQRIMRHTEIFKFDLN